MQAARADLERAQNEAQTYANKVVPEARGRAAQILQAADAYKSQTVAEATGQTSRFGKIYDEYKKAPEVTRKRMYLETMERVMAGTDKIILDSNGQSGSGVVPYLPLNETAAAANPGGAERRHPMRIGIAGGIVLVLVLAAMVLGYSSMFTVYQTQQALVVRLGQPVRVVTEPGLNFKVPLIDSVIGIDKRILDLENPAQEVIASDQKRLVVDAFARYRIQEPLRFYQTVNTIQGANSQLSVLLNAALRRVLGEATLTHVVRDERAQLMARVREQLDKEAQVYGITVVDVRIRRADLPEQNSQAVYQRMQTERQREAAEFRAQGSQKSQEIRSKADRDVTVLVAEATSKSEQVRGEGDGERNRIFAEAFGKDVDFFTFYRSMQAYEAGMRHGDTRMVLSPDSEFFRYFVDPSGKPRESQGRTPARRRDNDPANQQTITVGGNVRFSGRDRFGVCHRGDPVRRLAGAGEARDGACHRDARQRIAAGGYRVRHRRRRAGLAGSGLKRAEKPLFRPNPPVLSLLTNS